MKEEGAGGTGHPRAQGGAILISRCGVFLKPCWPLYLFTRTPIPQLRMNQPQVLEKSDVAAITHFPEDVRQAER